MATIDLDNMTELGRFLHNVLLFDMVANKAAVLPRLHWCRDAVHRQLEGCTEDDTVDEIEARLRKKSVGIIPRKVDDLESWMMDLLVRAVDQVFRLTPTVRPTLPDRIKDRVADAVLATAVSITEQRTQMAIARIAEDYLRAGVQLDPQQALQVARDRKVKLTPDENEIRDLTRELTATSREYMRKEAEKGSRLLNDQVLDVYQESGSAAALEKLVNYYVRYPFVILSVEDEAMVRVRRWKGDTLVDTRERMSKLRTVSPFDFYWTADSTNTQDGLGIAERIAMRRYEIRNVRNLDGAYPDEVDALLDDYERTARDWVGEKENPFEEATAWSNTPNETMDMFRMFCLVDGQLLKQYEDEQTGKVDEDTQYLVEAWLAGGRILLLRKHDGDVERPYWDDSYEPRTDTFVGSSLPENLAVVNDASRKGFTAMLRNMGKSTNPSLLVDRAMIGYEYLDEDEVILPDNQYEYMQVLGGSGSPVRLLEYPNYTNQVITFMEYMDSRADIESGIPRHALGQTQGLPSALRSTASLTLMIDNALKTVKARLFRLGTRAVAPAMTRMARIEQKKLAKEGYWFDANFTMQGLEGIITRGLVIGRIQELLQYLAPWQQSGQISPQVIQGLLHRFLTEAGIDNPEEVMQQELQQAGGADTGLPQGAQAQPPQRPVGRGFHNPTRFVPNTAGGIV